MSSEGLALLGRPPWCDFFCTNVFEEDIGRWIVPLKNDRAFLQPKAAAWISVRFTSVTPVRYLVPVYPNADVRSGSNNGLSEPCLIEGVHPSGIRATKNSSRTAIDGLGGVVVFE